MRKLRGLKKLVHDAVDQTVSLVHENHEAVAARTMRAFELAGPVAAPARVVDEVRRATTAGVFAAIHGVNRAVDALTDGGIDAVERLGGGAAEPETPAPMRSDAAGSAAWLGDAALGALNGLVGDFLHAQGNELDLGMSLRVGDRYLPVERAALAGALPGATDRVVLFAHGLCCTEWSWSIKAAEHHGDPAVSYGTLLQRELGFTPLYVRYNSGRHVSENGELLHEILEALVSAYPVEVRQLVLVGHSMGGLVARSACQAATERGGHWLEPLTHVICLGTPHRGAPLEKVGNLVTSILGAFDAAGTQVPARVINARSAGIKDLRFGSLSEEDWAGRDPDALLADRSREVPLLDGVTYGFFSATVTESPSHPFGQVVGDVLVRVPSARGPAGSLGRFAITTSLHGGMQHFDLQNHPEVYAEIRRLIEGPAPPASPVAT